MIDIADLGLPKAPPDHELADDIKRLTAELNGAIGKAAMYGLLVTVGTTEFNRIGCGGGVQIRTDVARPL
ncbi:hypothetical protein [Devosia sp.]|uniref:hypothetical protein n=1 Tax=Devosia sp. TaxID=1871048 RepID=UPI001AC81A82|nr:hypothetical protein [Devosia sp.]MBN9335376.1 hypothetical protein [Devosia sp.]